MPKKTEILKVRIDERLKKQVHIEAISQSTTMSDIAERALRMYLRNLYESRAEEREQQRRTKQIEDAVDDIAYSKRSLRKNQ